MGVILRAGRPFFISIRRGFKKERAARDARAALDL